MQIISGLFDNCVLQRTDRNRSEARIRAEVGGRGELRVRVTKGGRPVPGFRDKKLASLRQGVNEFRLAGLPVGGPYRVELIVQPGGRVVVKNVLVGDVWLAGGQSNMEGIGRMEHAAKPLPMVRAFYMSDRWDVARDPVHNLGESIDQVHADSNGGVRPVRGKHIGVGPAVGFVQEMWRRTGVPQGVIACAHGGTSMDQWDPAKKQAGSKSLYGAMLRRFEKNGRRCAGMIWYQGETDALTPDWVAPYTDKMVRFVRALRRDTRQRDLPVALVQLGRTVGGGRAAPGWNSVQDQQRRLPLRIPRLAVVPAIDLQLDDSIHIGGPDNNRLGHRLTQAMCALTGGRGEKLPIAVRAVRHRTDPVSGAFDVILEFDNVVGRLVAGGRPAGFTAGDGVFDIRLDGARAILKTLNAASQVTAMQVSYGSGTDPYCNITDEADRALPVFGPLTVGRPRALTPFVQRVHATSPLPTDGRDGLVYPEDLANLPWRVVDAVGNFCDLHGELVALAPESRLVYFTCRLQVSEPMKLAARLGYDGPVKLWVDGRELFHDQAGTNPATPDKAVIPFAATPGEHTVVVGFNSNAGKAWGIFLRFERRDVRPRQIEQGPENYRMPTVEV